MGFPRQQYCSGLPFPSPGDLPNPGIKPRSPALQADSLLSEPPGKPIYHRIIIDGPSIIGSIKSPICSKFAAPRSYLIWELIILSSLVGKIKRYSFQFIRISFIKSPSVSTQKGIDFACIGYKWFFRDQKSSSNVYHQGPVSKFFHTFKTHEIVLMQAIWTNKPSSPIISNLYVTRNCNENCFHNYNSKKDVN